MFVRQVIKLCFRTSTLIFIICLRGLLIKTDGFLAKTMCNIEMYLRIEFYITYCYVMYGDSFILAKPELPLSFFSL